MANDNSKIKNEYKLYYEEKGKIISETTFTIYTDCIIFSDWYCGVSYEHENEITYNNNKISSINKILFENNYKQKEIESLELKEKEFYESIENKDIKILFLYCLNINIFDANEFNNMLSNNNLKPDNYYSHYDDD